MKLDQYSLADLKAEVRRREGWDADPPERFCDDCSHFKPWPGGGDVPASYNPCTKNHHMRFFSHPLEWDFGFHRDSCEDFIPDDGSPD